MRTISGFDQVLAVAEYGHVMASIIQTIKRGERPELLGSLAVPLARLLRPCVKDSAILTWVPASPRGRRSRGFDQGRTLAEALGRELRIDRRPAFRRSGAAQRGADRAERIRGPHLHLRPDWARRPPTAQVIVVDDVITTGSSLAVAAATFGRKRPPEMIAGAIASRP
jgi:predicted amidophosphoribosyltransferase